MTTCGVINRDQMVRKTCVLALGHKGPHRNEKGETWTNGRPS